jgi:hypothetical protein
MRSRPRAIRDIGPIPNIMRMLDPVRVTVESEPDPKEAMRKIAAAIHEFSRVQDQFNRKIWGQYGSLPGPHAPTHMGGNDNVSGQVLPSPVTTGQVGAIGDATKGFAPILHIHDTTALTAAITAAQAAIKALQTLTAAAVTPFFQDPPTGFFQGPPAFLAPSVIPLPDPPAAFFSGV